MVFFGTKTVKNDFQLSNFVSRVRIEVLGNVSRNHNPKHIYKMLRASLSERLVSNTLTIFQVQR